VCFFDFILGSSYSLSVVFSCGEKAILGVGIAYGEDSESVVGHFTPRLSMTSVTIDSLCFRCGHFADVEARERRRKMEAARRSKTTDRGRGISRLLMTVDGGYGYEVAEVWLGSLSPICLSWTRGFRGINAST
jgi:hypothetical protein